MEGQPAAAAVEQGRVSVPTRYDLRAPNPDAARSLSASCGIGAAAAQVLLHRGLASPDSADAYLRPRLAELSSPAAMVDREAATDRIAAAIRNRERIVVFGDYDVDGTTSASILADVIEALGGDVTAMLANRFGGGYGFSEPALERALEANPGLIVTCDCGSSDHQRIAEARRRGVDTVVVDHHLVPEETLPAVAFLNPHRPECGFPYKGLASAGLAFYLGASLRTAMGSKLDLRPWLDLVALGTIADVAPLDGDNRRLVRAGLRALSSMDGRPGVDALKAVAQMRRRVGAIDVSFRLAPRINAAGRLGDPEVALELLRTRDPERARALAARLEELNDERKAVERRVTAEAMAQVLDVYGPEPDCGVVLAAEGWHRGVVGISAARVVDRFHVPVVVVDVAGGVGHGSCRAPDGFRLFDAVERCREDLVAFGGHQAAAGLTVNADRLEALRAGFADATRRLGPHGFGARVPVADVRLDDELFALPTSADLARLEPMGEANAEPLFVVENAPIEHLSVAGEGGHHLKLRLRVGRDSVPAFGYDLGDAADRLDGRATVLGHVRYDHFRGGDAVELRITHVA